jgi:hypothetical protein
LILLKIEMGVDAFFERRIAKRSTFGHLISLVNIVHEKKKLAADVVPVAPLNIEFGGPFNSNRYKTWLHLV